VNPQPPQRAKESWRWRGVSRAEPHLGERNGVPGILWIILGGVVFVLAILGVLFVRQMGSSTPVPAVIRNSTTIPPSLTALPTTPSPTVQAPSSTPRPISTNTPHPPTSTATATAAKPTAAFAKYRVQPGDTLSAIADKHHVSLRSIILLNGLRNDIIYVGQELIIPLSTPHP
jgi:LysM repeat protein